MLDVKAVKKVVVLEVSIYIHISNKDKTSNMVNAVSLLEFVDSKGKPHTRMAETTEEGGTKNALALKAAVQALKMLVKPCTVTIYTDNTYIKSCVVNGWMQKWQQDCWVKPDGSVPANTDLWKDFYISSQTHKIKFMPYQDRQEFNIKNKEERSGRD
ncbi:MAG: hypothetical protein K2K35_04500 [Lachnospiraceae bacterium]|nr:hypothetical protein [Lachnospiraceae bacterium]